MAKGILNIQAADGAVIGLHVPDGLTSGERPISLGVNLSGITAYHLLQGNLAVSASTITQGFNTTLYTSGSATTGIDMNTQWGNTAEEKFGGLVWLKDRVEATNNFLYDTVRGATKEINSNTTEAEATLASGLTAFNSTGFTVGADTGHNSTTNNMVSWNFQTTHRVTGTTNHGMAITNHYNPYSGFGIAVYTGSGLAGHDIQTMLGRKVKFVMTKNLTTAGIYWICDISQLGKQGDYLHLNLNNASTNNTNDYSGSSETSITVGTDVYVNTSGNQYVMYYWADSYLDKSNKLIGNYEIGVYQGTGAVGNKITTRGKPAWVMIKRIDGTGDWLIYNNKTANGFADFLYANISNVEVVNSSTYGFSVQSDGFTSLGSGVTNNASGGQYLYLVAYDTNSNGGGSYYPLASDTANVQVNNALIPIAQGIDSNGAKNIILSKNETFSGVTYTQGKNYPYYDALGNRGVSVHKPRYLESELVRTYAGESPDYFNVKEHKWYSTNSGSELVPNGTFTSNTTGWTATTGFTISVQNNSLKMDRNTTTPTGGVYQNISTVIGKKYKVTLDILYISGGGLSIWVDSGNTLSTYITTTGKQVLEFTANNSLTKLEFLQSGVAQTGTINLDNISLFESVITPTTEITNGRNYLNHIVYADNDGGVLYVEELPKIEYKDIVKANEFKGRNACTAWVNFDGTTTPPTIRDSYNVSAVIRTSTGIYDVYFKEDMDNTNYTTHSEPYYGEGTGIASSQSKPISTKKCTINTGGAWVSGVYSSTPTNFNYVSLYVQGGKN